jgi:tetratricopeptide (TPR) repeat protein
VQRCFQDHVQNVQDRVRRGEKLDPNEAATGIEARLDMEGCISKFIFDKNPGREFYVEESHIISWMYPYLEPHGLILKLNRKPLPQLDPAVVTDDREFWDALTKQLLTDPEFLSNSWARATYSKHRSAIGGVYAYRKLTGNAEHAFKQAVGLDPKSLEADFRLVQLYAEQNRFDDAITILKSLQQRVPSDQKLQAAITQFEKLKQSKPVQPPP